MTTQPNTTERETHEMYTEELSNTSNQPGLTADEAWVMDEIKSFHETWEHHEYQYDGMLRSLVLKISNIINPTVPTAYDNNSDLPELSNPTEAGKK